MALFGKTNAGGFMDVIRCDEPDYLIWKWHPAGATPGKNRRENAIRWGTSLRVREGSVAVFVYNQPDGVIQDYIVGPCDCRLDTKNLPVLANLVGALYGGDTPFQAEVYFFNLAQLIQVKFGVPYFDVFDSRFPDFGVPTAVRGTISFKVTDYREFVRLHQLNSFSLEDFQHQIRDAVSRYVKDAVTNAPAAHNIPVVQIESKTAQINDTIEYDIKERLKENFGVEVSGVDISAIEIDKTSEGYRQLKRVTQDISSATIQAQAEVEIKKMQDTQRIEAEHLEGTMKAQREEAQYAQRMQTQSQHFAAHQLNQQAAVGIAGAEALGEMGAAGGMDVNSGGMNPAAMMAGMAMGGAIGQNMAGMMNSMMSGVAQTTQTPPPIPTPTVAYHVAVNGQPSGPFDMAALAQMAAAGSLTQDSLVWKAGMPQWVKAEMIEELKPLLGAVPPVPTNE